MAKQNDIFKKGFDEGTQIKLHILQKYLQEWLPVFLKKKKKFWKDISLYDLFAGEGKDAEGVNGSPLIMMEELMPYCKTISNEKLRLNVLFNEFDKKRYDLLKQNIEEKRLACSNSELCPTPKGCILNMVVENQKFKRLFSEWFPKMKQTDQLPRFMFLDQFGIKQITEDIFRQLVSLKRTDFIFFISSSFANRFAEQPEFKAYLNLSRQSFDPAKPHHCHRVVFNYYKQLIPQGTEYYLAPFSIRKGTNIYGLIFGTHNPLGIEKFLNICWNINHNTGDANYDIDNEKINPNEPALFPGYDISNKLQVFKNELKEKIINDEITTNTQAYRFTYDMGCLPKHANEVFRELRNHKTISRDFRTCTSNVHTLTEEKLK
ncbi:MAG: three-Cys-motif partner protein TcmP [Bacteroidetes bacterium]|nr:three-Cys-motif partner protein TcmP [Bacteroidota bacterium]